MHGKVDLAKAKGLNSTDVKKLQRFLKQRIPTDKILTLELAEAVGEISYEIGYPLSLVLDRRGQVINVTVGLPADVKVAELRGVRVGPGRLCGQRMLYFVPASNKQQPGILKGPSNEDLQCLARNYLDLIAKIEVNPKSTFSRSLGEQVRFADAVHIVHLLPGKDSQGKFWKILPPSTIRRVQEENFPEMITSLENEFRKFAPRLKVTDGKERAILVGLITEDNNAWDIEDDLGELSQLARTAGATVCSSLTQARPRPDPHYFLGSGKAQELALMVQELGANLVIVDDELNANQQQDLSKVVGVKVIDRTELILDIFAQRAKTKEGKLQVELAQLKYLYPRLVGKGVTLSRLGGGIGTRGPGETKLEADRRRIRKRINQLEQETLRIAGYRETQRRHRGFENLPVIAITGYTNSGKSTLLNALTRSDALIEDKLFATLDPATRRTTLPDHSPVLFTDTVGFIKKLPTSLVAAFWATLEEVTVADALLHVVDASHPNVIQQIASVYDVLSELGAVEKPTITVLNKADKVRLEDLSWLASQVPNPVVVSALHRTGLNKLLTTVQTVIEEICPRRQRYAV